MITQFPIVSNEPQFPIMYYVDQGVVLAACPGDPNGIVAARPGTVLLDEVTPAAWFKTTAYSTLTGWVDFSGGGGGGLTPPVLITDNDSDTTPNYASFALIMNYDGTAALPSTLVNLGIESRVNFGPGGPAQGTLHGFTSLIDVIDSASSDNEFANFMGWARLKENGALWFGDFTAWGMLDGTVPEQLNGITMVVNNLHNGVPTRGPACGYIAFTGAGLGAGGEDGHASQPNFTNQYGFACTGYAGLPGMAPIRRGWDVAFQAGGVAGGWQQQPRSWIGVGLRATDYEVAGIDMLKPRVGSGGPVPGMMWNGWTPDSDILSNAIDFSTIEDGNIDAGGSIILLPDAPAVEHGITFGTAGTRLRVGVNNYARFDGKMVTGGDGDEFASFADALIELDADPTAGGVGILCLGVDAAKPVSMSIKNNGGEQNPFIVGDAGQFFLQSQIGDSGVQITDTKNYAIADVNGYRMLFNGALCPRFASQNELGANVNNWAPTVAGSNSISASTAVSITGMVAGFPGEQRRFYNAGSNTITVEHLDGGSSAANQFQSTSGADLSITAGTGFSAMYMTTIGAGKWVVTKDA